MSSKGPDQKQVKNWKQVISKVEAADTTKQNLIMNKLRKINYKETLQKQMLDKNQQVQQTMEGKRKEREEISSLTKQEKTRQMEKKLQKMKTERWYQMQNQSLQETKDRGASEERLQEKVRNDVLINIIIEDNEKRNLETRKIFQLQESLNKKQIQMRKGQKNQEIRKHLQYGQLEKAYVEREFQKKNDEIQLWKNKYIRKGRYGESQFDDKLAYSSYLDLQVAEKQSRTSREKEKIEEKLKTFNQSIQYPSLSPAYLGKLTQSYDRKLQLSILDRHMKFRPDDLLARQSETERSMNIDNNKSLNIYEGLPNHRKRQASQPQFSHLNKKIDYNNSLDNSNQPKIAKKFTSYDFITGTPKTFFI